ncbi:MAG: hypothetical protein JNK19_16210 [Tabrizicola sp.]|nr:hypothetical protein [Tabrizicola sp.]
MRLALALLASCLSTLPLAAQTCSIDLAAVEARIAELEPSYGLVLSDIGCDVNTIPARKIMCESAEDPQDDTLWRMGRLDTLAWVYAIENATGQQVNQEDPPLDETFIAARDACTDAACLCDVLIQHTNDSLGGTSPYQQ